MISLSAQYLRCPFLFVMGRGVGGSQVLSKPPAVGPMEVGCGTACTRFVMKAGNDTLRHGTEQTGNDWGRKFPLPRT